MEGIHEVPRILTRSTTKVLVAIGLILVAIGVFSPEAARAEAQLFISPSSGAYKVGDLFSVLVKVNTGGKAINAGSAQVNFDNQRLEITSVGYSQSIFTIWTEEPRFSNAAGTISFSGGLPHPGFTGSSGAIMRITFKAKAAGSAPVIFTSGSVHASDGQGTNILSGFSSALFTVLEAAPQAQSVKPEPAKEITPSAKPEAAPVITEYPKEIEAGSTLTIRGVGNPNSKILMFFQKGELEPLIQETFAGPDGRFAATYRRSTESGFYRVWVRSVGPSGVSSPPSEAVIIEVTKPLFFRIGDIAVNFVSIIVTLIALLLLALLLLIWSWVSFRKWRASQGKEISEAEKALHHGFDKLKDGLGAYIGYLTETKSVRESKERAKMTQKELKEELEDIEEEIEREVEDIKRPKH